VWVDRRGAEIGPATALDEVAFPRLSPDGRTLAMVQHGDLWVQDLSGRPAIKLTFDGIKDEHFAPLWSADGQRLIYETIAPAPLRSVPADASSSTPTVVSPTGHFHPHGWTKNGELLAVVLGRQTTTTDIVMFPLGEKSEVKDVVATPAVEGGLGATLSPDGHWLAYAANPTDRVEVWVRPFPGPGAPVRVSPAGGSEPLWSRNGRELFYVEDGERLMSTTITPAADFRFSTPVQLFVTRYNHSLQVPTYDVAPDGRFIMLKARADASATTLNVIVNWVEEVERRANAGNR
jgi:Tol biopolymer transport system component